MDNLRWTKNYVFYMGININIAPDSFRSKIQKEDRKSIGIVTISEAQEKNDRLLENKMHNQFIQWLRLRGLDFIHARTDRKSTIEKGWPDFSVVYNGNVVMIEFKTQSGKLSEDQENVIKRLMVHGNDVHVCTSVQDAIGFCCCLLNEH